MIKDPERFKNISTGIQQIIFAIAIIVGGVWTAFTFSTLESRNIAEAGLKETELRIAKTHEEIAEKGAVIDIKLDARQEFLHDSKDFCIAVVARFTNIGVKNTKVDMSKEPPLSVYLVSFNDDGTTYRDSVVSQKDYNMSATVARTGHTIEFPLFVKVKRKGLYFLQFRVELDEQEKKIDSAKRGIKLDDLYWMNSTYVSIK